MCVAGAVSETTCQWFLTGHFLCTGSDVCALAEMMKTVVPPPDGGVIE